MRQILSKFSTPASALLLTVLVLSVFALSRDRGPESTVRRFHVAVSENNNIGIIREMVDGDRQSGQYLVSTVRQALSLGATVQLGRVYTDGKTSYVDVVYTLSGNHVRAAYRFVVVKEDLKWRIDAGRTIALQSQMYEFS